MAKKGALKSVYIVNDDELRVNGGRWLLQSGPALRVRGFTTDTLGDRKVTGGDALPVYVLGENDIRANGGQFLLKGGQPISVTSAIGSARGVIQGKAIPIWPVDDDGNFDSGFAGFLPTQIAGLLLWLAADLGLSLADAAAVALWPDQSGNGNDGSQAVGAEQPTFRTGIINGLPIVRFDGTNDNLELTGMTAALGSFTMFFAGNPTNNAVGRDYFMDIQTGRLIISNDANAAGTVGWFDGAWKQTGAATYVNQILAWVFIQGGNGEVFRNGASLGVAAYTAVAIGGAIGMGTNFTFAQDFFQGDWGEFIIYEGALSVADRQSVETYLSNKWAIP